MFFYDPPGVDLGLAFSLYGYLLYKVCECQKEVIKKKNIKLLFPIRAVFY